MNTASVLPILGELFAKSALITLAAILLARAWRGATAAQRHLLWFVTLVTVMLLPLTRLVTPFWRIPLGQVKPVVVVKMEPSFVPSVSAEKDLLEERVAPPAPLRMPADWREILLGVWLSGAVLLLGYRLVGSWRLHQLMRRSIPLDDPRICLLLSRTLSELRLHRRSEIRLSNECRVPVTWGSLRPVMLLPSAALHWSDTWILAALRHEAAHISRYDYLTRWFAQLACALYWPNPLVWLLARSLRVAQELAADDLVLRAGTPAEEYASQLVEAAREITTHGFFVRQAVAMACPSTLEDRVRAIVDGRRDRRPLSRLAAACGSVSLAGVLALSTAAQLRSDEQKPASESKETTPHPLTSKGPQIEIEAKFVEITSSAPEGVDAPTDPPAIFSDPQFQVIMRGLSQKKGVDIFSSPRVATLPNLRAVIEVVRELRAPIDWMKEGDIWKPTKFETKNPGVTLEVEPRMAKDGTIELHTVSSVVKFLGFLDLDSGKTIPAPTTTPGEPVKIPPVVPGHRSKAIYSERRKESTVTLKSGETLQLADLPETADTKAFENDRSRNRIIVFISPRIIAPAPTAAQKEPQLVTKEWKIPPTLIPTKPDGSGPESVRDWLTSRGVVFNGGSSAVYVASTQRLIVRNKTAQLDLVDQILGAGAEDPKSATPAGASKPPGTIDLNGGTQFLNANGEKDAEFLRRAYLDLTGQMPTPDEIRAFLADPAPSVEKRKAIVEKLTLGAGNARSNHDQKPAAQDPAQQQIDEQGGRLGNPKPRLEAINGQRPGSPAAATKSAALAKAEKMVIPRIEMREATLEESLELLRKKAVELDPDKTGVKIVVKPGTTSEARITLSLSNVSLIEALKYVTALANMEFVAKPDALMVQPMTGGAPGASAAPREKPVEMQADQTRMENGVAIAEGHAHLAFGKYDAAADTIRYHPDTHAAELFGHAEVKDGGNLTVGGEIGVSFSTGNIRVLGSPHPTIPNPNPSGLK